MNCDGICYEGHKGSVKRVNVKNKSQDWGEFNYCDAAIEDDRRRGFEVTELAALNPFG